jgi:4-amino-4-deoxy-L-arabinose transferase-like glycosyltransferase
MPDIGLLQGPPRPRLIVVPTPLPPKPADEAAPASLPEAPPAVPPLIPMADEPVAIKVAAHASVVSDAPVATLTRVLEEPVIVAASGGATNAREVSEWPAATAPALVASESPAVAVSVQPATAQAAKAQVAPASPSPSPSPASPAAAPVIPLPVKPPQVSTPSPIRLSDLLWLLLALALIVGTGVGIRDPWPADEPRFASLARDMAQTGEWLFPRVGGDLYQDKPPLFFWLLAVCYTLFGSVKASFLVPSLLAAGGVLFLVYDFGRRTVSREAGLAAGVALLCSLQFVLAMRGAQIDPLLCLLTTFSVYALLRHLLLGDGWRWYVLAGFAAGLGVFTKGVGFLPILLLAPYFALRAFGWQGLANIDAGRVGWRWWLAPLAMLFAISLWFAPMLIAVANGAPEYAAYRDEILFKQTVGRYAAAWHHVKGWYYFLVEVIPPLWLPWSVLLFWLVPRFKAAYHERNARVWLPLSWVLLVVVFFSMSPGKRGIYILPALPVLALASLPVLPQVLARRGVRIAGFVLGIGFFLAALAMAVGHAAGARFAMKALADANLASATPLYLYLALCGVGLAVARARAPLLAWPVALASLTIVFSYFIAPAMNGERSGKDFVRAALTQVKPDEQLGLVAYKEQFLLYLDRPTTNFGHRRWQEGPQEYFDAAAWLTAAADRVLLVPEEALVPKDRFDPSQPAIPCFTVNATKVGTRSGDDWYLVRAPAEAACAALGHADRAIPYPAQPQ